MKWSILVLSWNRPKELKQMWAQNITPMVEHYGDQCEILVCDQGTKPPPVFHDIPRVTYARLNGKNEGTPRALNQLLIRSKGEHVAIMGNDILLPNKWWEYAEAAFENVPKCGLVGFECAKPPMGKPQMFGNFEGIPTKAGEGVFGDWCFTRELSDDVGAFCGDYHPYGLWDSDFNFRVQLAGYQSVYCAGVKSPHIGGDVGHTTDYRKMKDFSLQNNAHTHHVRAREYARFGYYEPFPAKIRGA